MQDTSTRDLLDELRRRIAAAEGRVQQELLDDLYAFARDHLAEMSTGQLLDLGTRCTEETDRRFDDDAKIALLGASSDH